MGFINQFPYSDAHELNLDWVIAEVKRLRSELNDYEAANQINYAGLWDITKQYAKWSVVLNDEDGKSYISLQTVPEGINVNNADYWRLTSVFKIDTSLDITSYNAIANKSVTYKFDQEDARLTALESGLTAETAARSSADTTLDNKINTNASNIASEVSNRTAAEAVINGRIDDIISGASVDPNAELIDIRTGFNSTSYASAGDAVRGSDTLLNNNIYTGIYSEETAFNILNNDRINAAYSDTNIDLAVEYYFGSYFDTTGFGHNQKFICCKLPAGTYLMNIPDSSQKEIYYEVYEQTGSSTGTKIVSSRATTINFTSTHPIWINIKLQANTVITADDVETMLSVFTIKTAGKATRSTLFDNSNPNAKIAEFYVMGGVPDDVNITRITIAADSFNIALYSNTISDWCSYLSVNEAPQTGVVYEIPEYGNSGISAYMVFKDVTPYINTGVHWNCEASCYIIDKQPTIQQYLVDKIKACSPVLSTQKIVFLGDSIFGQNRTSTSIPSLVGDYTGATTYNCALGGTEGNSHGSSPWMYFDFTELSKAIVSGDFSDQVAHENDSGVPSYFAGVFDTLEALDFSTVNIICLTYGGNDYGNGHSNITQFVEAMEENINRILTAYPNIRFLIMNPPYKMFLDPKTHEYINDGDTKMINGLTLKDFAESFKVISSDIHVPYINAYDDLGINRYNAPQWFITNDGSHPNETGRKETAKLLAAKLNGMLYS